MVGLGLGFPAERPWELRESSKEALTYAHIPLHEYVYVFAYSESVCIDMCIYIYVCVSMCVYIYICIFGLGVLDF